MSARVALPIDPLLPEIRQATMANSALVVHAPPGAGKTTRVPVALLDDLDGQIVMLEPRRVAARSAARRIAAELGVQLGEEVGYRIRFENRAGPLTRLLVVTEGVLVRMLQQDPFLEGVAAVIIDEFHERSIHADLALAMTRRVQKELRDDLKLLVMSATLDVAPLTRYLEGAPLLESRGRTYPVEVEWRPIRGDDPRIEGAVARTIRHALYHHDGDILVFLPGAGEIQRCASALGALEPGVDIHALHGSLSAAAQDAAIRSGSRRKVVLATNIAETSLTIEGVRVVIDSGLHRLPRYDSASGLDRLELRRICRASAEQRRGRAGRVREGHCIRLWSEAEHATLAPFDPPEIRRVDLSSTLLQLMAWGERDVMAFPFFEAPEQEPVEEGLRLLKLLGAVDSGGVTPLGHRMAALPLAPRLARLLLEGEALGFPETAAELAAILEARDLLAGGADVSRFRSRSDLLDRLQILRRGRAGRGAHDDRRVRDEALAQIRRSARAHLSALQRDPGAREAHPPSRPGDEEEAALRMLVPAFPDRVTQARDAIPGHSPDDTGTQAPPSRRGVMVGRRGVVLGRQSAVRDASLYLSIDVHAERRGRHADAEVRMASEIDVEWLPLTGIRKGREVFFDEDLEAVVARDRTWFEDLLIDERNAPAPDPLASSEILAEAALRDPQGALALDREEIASLLRRLAFAERWCPEVPLPRPDEDTWRRILPTLCWGRRSLAELRRIPATELLSQLLDRGAKKTLDELLPTHLTVPSGTRHLLRYDDEDAPILAVRIQEVFGWTQTPRVAAGRVPVLLHLLAPNRRPAQITSDLESFWSNTYPEVRKELRQRYPKHFWPEDPRSAPATTRTKKAMDRGAPP